VCSCERVCERGLVTCEGLTCYEGLVTCEWRQEEESVFPDGTVQRILRDGSRIIDFTSGQKVLLLLLLLLLFYARYRS